MKKVGIAFGIIAAAAVLFLVLGGTEKLEAWGLEPEEVVRDRVNAYWQARVEGDAETLMKLAHPSQAGQTYDPGMLVTEGFQIEQVEIDGETAVATVNVQFRLKHPSVSHISRDKQLQGRWVLYEGQWYRTARDKS